ncbi:MAG: DEAD/DEAH box helicase [Deltaproteobacteria bacterium]|jgi:ATP-dependent DNA helicase RecG|nr:DEAD/DEAH box helicase [Deltaproteobacteria bacterium]
MIPWPKHSVFTTKLDRFPGAGEAKLKVFKKKGINVSADLLSLPPSRYMDRREFRPLSSALEGQEILFSAMPVRVFENVSKKGKPYLMVKVEDLTGTGAKATLWFFNWLSVHKSKFKPGRMVGVFGFPTFKESRYKGMSFEIMFSHPEIFLLDRMEDDEILGIFPFYSPIKPISSNFRSQLIENCLKKYDDEAPVPTVLPQGYLLKHNLKDPTELIKELHKPDVALPEPLLPPKESRPYRLLALHELIIWRYLVLREKQKRARLPEKPREPHTRHLGRDFVTLLPFALSPEQARVTDELLNAISGPKPANQLLQGEVGSGKTAVVSTLLFEVAGAGLQGALIAPTELLSRQHYDFLLPYAKELKVPIALLTGSTPAKEKRSILRELQMGLIKIVVGTQALFTSKVAFQNLSLAVIDEQHRFGVRQRLAMRMKNPEVDLVSLSATPIPRSLAQALYGDMDISSLKGVLPGRKTPETIVFDRERAPEAYALLAKLVRSGEQAFAISPRIGSLNLDYDEDKETESAKGPSLSEMEKQIKSVAPELKIGTIHGKLETLYRSDIMQQFRDGKLNILLSTTIVEVGVDIQGANVMLIEGAENMGLAQLHQLRGRIGRGGGKATLILIPHGDLSDNAKERFKALTRGHDGYALAELDLTLRGPGEELGLKQSGWPKFSFCKFPRDLFELPRAIELAEDLYNFKNEFSADLSQGLDTLGQSLAEEALGV